MLTVPELRVSALYAYARSQDAQASTSNIFHGLMTRIRLIGKARNAERIASEVFERPPFGFIDHLCSFGDSPESPSLVDTQTWASCSSASAGRPLTRRVCDSAYIMPQSLPSDRPPSCVPRAAACRAAYACMYSRGLPALGREPRRSRAILQQLRPSEAVMGHIASVRLHVSPQPHFRYVSTYIRFRKTRASRV